MPFKPFEAEHGCHWTVDGTELTLVTDSDLLGQVRQYMREDLARQDRNEGTLVCVHWSDSFQGKTGAHVHGRSWKLHKPQADKQFGCGRQ